MSTTTHPSYDDYCAELNLDYIRSLGAEIRALLAEKIPVGVAYRPGNGTQYSLILCPVRAIEQVSKWSVPAGVWDRNGIADAGWTVVSHVERRSIPYPINLSPGHVAHAGYVAEHLGEDPADAVALTALFRAISSVNILDGV